MYLLVLVYAIYRINKSVTCMFVSVSVLFTSHRMQNVAAHIQTTSVITQKQHHHAVQVFFYSP